MDDPVEVRNEDGTVPKWARRVTDTFVDATGIRDAKYRELVESIEAAEKATNGVFSSKSAGGILDMNAYREMEEEDRIATGREQARRNAEAAQLAKLRAERDRIDEEAARARIKAATEAMAAAPRDKKKADAAGAPFKLVKVVKKKPTPAATERTTTEEETVDEEDAGGLRGLLGGYGSDDSADGVDVAPPSRASPRAPMDARNPPRRWARRPTRAPPRRRRPPPFLPFPSRTTRTTSERLPLARRVGRGRTRRSRRRRRPPPRRGGRRRSRARDVASGRNASGGR